ncbi:heavy metal translocating P-type ATPase [Caldinitratiruptor microaerophilus]|uniref:Cd(2+)-exporting ATPase n=1 Tax=Caldinitratiruptor microaerophilus TaxID=671077 RepID=A0AA35CMS4_9FIRM|nr:cation-translocating P-type ATPase [Caldinitratiruptor microaerophilus]BDG62189.1 haloacid dehalogenase [Caldinitratiruptor microaerophilus]
MTCRHERLHRWLARHGDLLTVLAAGALIAAAWTVRLVSPGAAAQAGLYDGLMAAAAVIAGAPIAREAWGRLRAGQFSIPLLVSVAALGALWIRETWEAAAVTFLYVFGGYLESLTLARTRAALRTLVDLLPRTARVRRGEALEVVDAAAVRPGDTVVVLPGDRVPVDGTVVAGRAALDTAALTGEPLPAEVGPGDPVLGGSVSRGGYLEVVAERVGPDTTFSRLVYLVAEAQEQKPKVQRFLDRFARWYTPAVLAAAGVLYLLTRDVELALTFLVIGCPGALVVAAPVAVVAGLGSAARQGILIKGGERLERIGKVDVVAFDKTGTLTMGQPRVTAVVPLNGDATRVLALAAVAEQRSEHHLAAAILAHAKAMGIEPEPASEWTLEPGLGAVARGEAGEILVGNRRLLAARGIALTAGQEALVAAREAEGETVALVAAGGVPVGIIGITDPIRPEAAGLVAALRRVGVRRTVMLTGDHRAAAERVARRLGVDEVRAGLLPEEKVAAIRSLQAQGHVVAMVGDGVNDAPALATADVSIAMGASGTRAALEAADVALMADRLDMVPYAIGLSRRILAVVRQNVAFAVAVVVLLLAGVLGRVVFLGSGMLIHEASVLLVILNGMRLLRTPGAGDGYVQADLQVHSG